MDNDVKPVRRRGGVSAESGNVEEKEEKEPTKYPKDEKTLEHLDTILKNNILFNHLEEKERKFLWQFMFEKTINPGQVIIQQDDPEADNFFVIESGEAEVFKDYKDGKGEIKVFQYGPKGFFGELALMYNTPRAATVKAKTTIKVWAIDRVTFRKYLMNSTKQKREKYEQFLSKVPILVNLDKYERLTIADALIPHSFKDGEVIIKEGETGDKFFIIAEGRVKVTKEGKEQSNSPLLEGNYFGEISLLTDEPRQATLTAVGEVRVVYLERESFDRLMGSCQDILNRNMENYKNAVEKQGN
eukprot:TRINITY_DN12185_c0_g1_i1.p1 TRINITY_DN12185_c0_g1~~TRINITY_DN12185_c0_g1_i1.p1  ORF type:complete len:300 (-),score=99.32 TRINITY_DN12185_c0_g1_i1:116-1015(-)